jgi:hypothetical protein
MQIEESSLWALKQAPRAWYIKIDRYLENKDSEDVLLTPISMSKAKW